ncbi:MAG: hypothetical protein CVU73_06450 [Deltaproteobacteria bacterium HGW-Deltaproteobacteria-8]|nr:MAG: hypothetical protein CVU73_06450 [Deltaproteobacteria bacterium HGW-Deltaproteobacteria-8]
MSSDPPAVPHRVRTCPARADHAAPGGFPGIRTVLFCLVLLLSALGPGRSGPALAAPLPGAAPPSPLPKELLVAAPANMPPFYVPAADGTPGGFAVEVLRRVATNAGFSLRFIPTATIVEAVQLLRQGKVQVVPGLGASPAREQDLGFTRPLETLPVHIFFRAATQPLETLDDLAGKRLALVAGSIPAERLRGRTELNILLTPTLAEAIFDVLAGQADALVYLAPVVRQAASAAGVEQKLGRSARPLFEIGRALAVNRDSPQVLARLDTALHAFSDTQEFRELYRKWHAEPDPPSFSPVALWTMAAFGLALSAALLAWRSFSLLRLNRRLTLAVTERDRALAAQGLTEERLEALFTLAHMEAASTEELVDFALEQGVRLTGSQNGYLIFVEGEGADRGLAVWSRTARERCALLPELHENATFTISQGGLWAECLRTGVPSIINDYPSHPGRRPLPEGHAPIARHMGVPLVEDGRALVIFGVGDKAEPYDDTDARQLQLFLSGLWRVLKARRDANEIRQARDYAESLLEGANAMVVGLDRAGRVTTFNAAAEQITGRTQSEMLGSNWFTTLYSSWRAKAIAANYAKVMNGEIELSRHDETPLVTKDGRQRLISWRNSLLRQGQEITGLIAFGIDITERKQAEEALKEQNSEILTLFNGVPAMIFYKSLDNRILRANEAWFRTMGLDESILGVALEDVYPAEFARKVREDDREVIQSGQAKMNIQEDVATPQGLRRFIAHKLPRRDAKGAVTGLICVANDITDLRRAEEALAQSEEMFRTLAEDSPALICRSVPGCIITYVNKTYQDTFRKTADELVGTCFLEYWPPEERERIRANIESLTPEAPVNSHEHTLVLPDGSIGWQSWTDRALFDAGGNIRAFQSVGVDITARKQSEIELKRLHRAIDHAAEGVLITDKNGIITYINPALEHMTGLSSDEARKHGLSVQEVQQTVLQHQDSAVSLDECGGVWRGTSSFARPHGQNVEVEFTVSAIRDTDGEVMSFVAVCRDVTEKRLLERQLWQAQKMEALGTLAGGIAHDFNNILASIMGFTELALDDTPPESRARGSLARVLKASSRAKELVRQILTFSRRTEREQHTLHADKVIGEALRLMEASLPKNIEISASLQAQDCAILADPSQTHQIVMNLCTNAAQAMKSGGRMSVATRLVRLGDNSLANPHRLPAGQYLSLTVEDTGEGIAPDVLGRIFDPFFTTKGSGEGTGLGLAVVHGIVLSLGGTVFAESEPGQGARLTMLLPTAPDSPAPAHEPYPGNPTGRERILLVDDESDLLDMVCQFLEPLGYQVAPHNQPETALEAFLASPQSFDLVLTDQSMPRLSGIQLATRLREVRPDLPVVLCSGFSMVIPPDRIQALGKAWLLAKPFTSGELTRVVRQALANTRGEVHAS